MIITSCEPSPQAKAMLADVREAVARTLERKKRLGQYAVIWQNSRPVQIGEDAPTATQK